MIFTTFLTIRLIPAAYHFRFKAIRSVARNFTRSAFGIDLASSFAAMNLALATWVCTTYVTQFKRTKIGNPTFRNVVSKFGPSMVTHLHIMSFDFTYRQLMQFLGVVSTYR